MLGVPGRSYLVGWEELWSLGMGDDSVSCGTPDRTGKGGFDFRVGLQSRLAGNYAH